jgi:glycosyltransferase involved in cell wall biosynthesis
MKCGSLVYDTAQGLGVLARMYYDVGLITHVAVIHHGSRPSYYRYPGAPRITDLRRQQRELEAFCASVDVMLFLETPFSWELIDFCKRRGVKTVLQVQYECTPEKMPAQPDLILCPSLLDAKYYPDGVYLPVPVNVPWKQRTRAEVFVHNSGNGGLRGRNGTKELLDAMRFVRQPVRLLVRAQEGLPGCPDDPRIEFRKGTVPHSELHAEGDVFIHPTKFDGLSLPIQEARAAGMLVITNNRFPMNEWLPREPLIPVKEYRKARVGPPYNEFDEAVVDPRDIAATIDRWYGADITAYSLSGREWAEQHSWERLKPRYVSALEALCASAT